MRWAQELVEDMHQFPSGEHDDTHDACIMAVTYLRNANLIQLQSDASQDHEEEPSVFTGATETTLYY